MVLETTVNELKVECGRAYKTEIPSETDVIAKASNNVTNNMDFMPAQLRRRSP